MRFFYFGISYMCIAQDNRILFSVLWVYYRLRHLLPCIIGFLQILFPVLVAILAFGFLGEAAQLVMVVVLHLIGVVGHEAFRLFEPGRRLVEIMITFFILVVVCCLLNWNLSGNNNSEQHQILCPSIDYTVFRSFRANMQDAGAQFFFYTIADGSANT